MDNGDRSYGASILTKHQIRGNIYQAIELLKTDRTLNNYPHLFLNYNYQETMGGTEDVYSFPILIGGGKWRGEDCADIPDRVFFEWKGGRKKDWRFAAVGRHGPVDSWHLVTEEAKDSDEE